MEFNPVTGKTGGEESNVQHNFGRHEAHKHHDTMGEIVQGDGDADFPKFKYNHDSDFVDNRFKEVKHPESDDAHRGNKDGRHAAHKHHDTMGEIVRGDGKVEKLN